MLTSDYFGYETAISDDGLTLAVLAKSAPSTTSTTEDAGAVYLYRRYGINGQKWRFYAQSKHRIMPMTWR